VHTFKTGCASRQFNFSSIRSCSIQTSLELAFIQACVIITCVRLPCLPFRKQSSVDETVEELKQKGHQNVAGCVCHVGSAEQRALYIKNAVQVCVCV
jgi:hypothetical protein